MSTFRGLVEEIPGISVDRFDDENLSSSAYFLTHCHSDHTQGLGETFFHRLKEKNCYIYCTRLTKLFLVGKYRLDEDLASFIKELRPCSPTIVDYVYENRNESVVVNSVPAGHCPGSVMFVFERPNSRVLCTGDFRISPSDFPKLKPLNVNEGGKIHPQKFDKIYLDTTFLNSDYPEFPTRQRSLDEVSRAAVDWISRDSRNVVSIECSALYGSEFFYIELWEKLKKPVHVKPFVYNNYSRIHELSRSITDNPGITPIHACARKDFSRKTILECRGDVENERVLTIVISAMRWRNRDISKSISEFDEIKKNRFYVCTSMHPSYNELKAFVDYFKPKDIHPCVDPPLDCKVSAVDILNEMRKKESPPNTAEETLNYDLESLIGNCVKRARTESRYISDDSSD